MSNVTGANFDESLINLVRLNPQLFVKEKRIKPYDSMKQKAEVRALWRSIATTLGVEPSFCMIRWKQLCERYRRESQIHKRAGNASVIVDYPFIEKMRFLDWQVSFSHKLICHEPNDDSKPNVTSMPNSDQIYGGINYEYLPEAMEAQSSSNVDTTTTTNKVMPQMMLTSTNSVLVRIKALLEGLDPVNRGKAEKRILSYLCKCQLRALENESIDDIGL